jgi:hypothetical protein
MIPSAAVVAQITVPVVTGNARVDTLVSEMMLEEKMDLIRGNFEDPPGSCCSR